jgi:hypothetical protein
LLRRATFDLTGLPPSEREIQEFLADDSPKAFEKVVERLLASPRYGERWGRHWLDVARYGDSTGGDEDFSNPYAWRYRDYVIQAFNRDLPYDQFIVEQIAGDLLPAEKPGEVNVRGIVATAFSLSDQSCFRKQTSPKCCTTSSTSRSMSPVGAVMGLTVACARCHDHKFDPIPLKITTPWPPSLPVRNSSASSKALLPRYTLLPGPEGHRRSVRGVSEEDHRQE